MKVQLVDLYQGQIKEQEIDFPVADVRKDILARAVRYQLAKKRSGNHKTKTRGEIACSTRKPFRQKGTGMARRGRLLTPICRGGGIVFGPVVRSHAHKLPKKVLKFAVASAVASKIQENKLFIIDSFQRKSISTKSLVQDLKKTGWESALFITDNSQEYVDFALSLRNLHKFNIIPCEGLNVYSILKHDVLVCSQSALDQLKRKCAINETV